MRRQAFLAVAFLAACGAGNSERAPQADAGGVEVRDAAVHEDTPASQKDALLSTPVLADAAATFDTPGGGDAAVFAFVHPGIIVGPQTFQALRNSQATEPQKSAWAHVASNAAGASGTFISASYAPHPVAALSFVSGATSVGWREFVGWDAPAAYHNALAWAVTRDPRFAEKVMQILDAWATKNPSISGGVNQTALDVSKALSSYLLAHELVKHTYAGWDAGVEGRWRSFLTERCLPKIDNSSAWTSVLKNGRTMMIRANMMVAIVQNDKARFDRMVTEFRKAVDDETYPSGQVQDTMRDIAHAMAQVAGLVTVAELAWLHGVDLYAYRGDRLLKIAEFHARLRNGYTAAQHAAFGLVADYPPNAPDPNRRVVNADGTPFVGVVGGVQPYADELVFHHYVHRRGLSMPALEQRVRHSRVNARPDGYLNEGVGLYTLTHGRPL